MFNRKQLCRRPRDGIAASLVIFARFRCFTLRLGALVTIVSNETAPPTTRPVAADDDLAGARLLYARSVMNYEEHHV